MKLGVYFKARGKVEISEGIKKDLLSETWMGERKKEDVGGDTTMERFRHTHEG